MDSLELPALRDILAGSVFMFNNQNLCHIQTIDWDEIITGKYAQPKRSIANRKIPTICRYRTENKGSNIDKSEQKI